uniref:Putative secreted protein n=1 Tax=Anopheles darlingi TaxID=43151 RepID=A0A2M4D6Z4_ANODA
MVWKVSALFPPSLLIAVWGAVLLKINASGLAFARQGPGPEPSRSVEEIAWNASISTRCGGGRCAPLHRTIERLTAALLINANTHTHQHTHMDTQY